MARLLLERYRAGGEAFLDGLTGSFSVTLFDPQKELTVLACDGLGNGYLAYGLSAGRLAVSSDDATVLAELRAPSRYSATRLAEFFTFAELSGPETFFEDVKALLPGEMLIFEAGRVRRRSLRRPRLDQRIERANWEDYVEEFAELLGASVYRCLSGLDRVAVLMSGGLDSAPIAALAARHLATGAVRAPVTALSWKMSDSRADESMLIRMTAEQAGIDVEWIDCDDATPFSDLPNWPVHPSSPQQTAYRWFHQRSFSRAAGLGHRVVLAGFCGDVLYVNARKWAWDLLSAEGPGRTIDRLREVAAGIGWRKTLRTHLFGPLLPRMRSLRRYLPPYLTENARQHLDSLPRWPADLETALRPHQAVRVLALLDARGENFERYFTKPFGLELRSPLRDFALVQFMLAVPNHLLQQGTETRPVLRAATRGLIPEEVRLRREKAAFYDVLDRGMATEKLRWTKRLLLDPDALWRGFIAESSIRSWIETSPTDNWGKMGYLHAIYGELWRRKRAGLPWPSADAVD